MAWYITWTRTAAILCIYFTTWAITNITKLDCSVSNCGFLLHCDSCASGKENKEVGLCACECTESCSGTEANIGLFIFSVTCHFKNQVNQNQTLSSTVGKCISFTKKGFTLL